MATLKQVQEAARKLGATVDTTNGECNIEAPTGYTWESDPGVHELIGPGWDDEEMPAVYRDQLDRMSMGVYRCLRDATGRCEWCADKRREERG